MLYFLQLIFLSAGVYTSALQGKYKINSNSTAEFTTNGVMTDLNGKNKNVQGIVDFTKKQFAVKLAVKEFIFDNSLMQKHFNENYMESDKYPLAKYTGTFTLATAKGGAYTIKLTGKMEMHGVTQPLNLDVPVTEKGNKVSAKIEFGLKPEDYKIAVPNLVYDKVGDNAIIKVNIEADKMP